MASLTAAAVAPPVRPLRLSRRGVHSSARPRAPPHARRGAKKFATTTALATVVSGDAELAPLTAVIVGGGLGGLAACVALRRVGMGSRK